MKRRAEGRSQLQLRQGSTVYCTLTIADGTTTSASVNGFGLAAADAGSLMSLDILSVPRRRALCRAAI